jgi:hypothetical protein
MIRKSFPDHALVANGWFELLLFCGVAFHVHTFAAPRFTSHLASVTTRQSPLVASVEPRLASLVATSVPRLTPAHTGRCGSGWC